MDQLHFHQRKGQILTLTVNVPRMGVKVQILRAPLRLVSRIYFIWLTERGYLGIPEYLKLIRIVKIGSNVWSLKRKFRKGAQTCCARLNIGLKLMILKIVVCMTPQPARGYDSLRPGLIILLLFAKALFAAMTS